MIELDLTEHFGYTPGQSEGEEPTDVEYPKCTICLEEMKVKAILLPCGHLFDPDCLNQWIVNHNWCPNCRAKIGN